MGKTTNFMGNFRVQFPLAILQSDIWFPYLCLPSSGHPLIPVCLSRTSLYLSIANQADNITLYIIRPRIKVRKELFTLFFQ